MIALLFTSGLLTVLILLCAFFFGRKADDHNNQILKTFMMVLVVLAVTFIPVMAKAQTMVLDPASDVEISWDGGGTYSPLPVTAHTFSTDPITESHAWFGTFGANDFVVDVSEVLTADPNTRLDFTATITDPGTSILGIWTLGWVRFRSRVEMPDGSDDVSMWSEPQFVVFRRPRPAPKPSLVRP